MRERGTSGSMAVEPWPGAKAARSWVVGGRKTVRVRRVERDAGVAAVPGARWQAGDRSVPDTAYGSKILAWCADCRRNARTIGSHPNNPEKRRRGWASFKNKTPKAQEWRHTPTHPAATRARPGATKERKGLRPRLARSDSGSGRRAEPTRRREWLEACTMWRAREPLRKAGTPSDRPTIHQRARALLVRGGLRHGIRLVPIHQRARARLERVPFFGSRASRTQAPTSTKRDGAVDCKLTR